MKNEIHSIDSPHPDIENHWVRGPLRYVLTSPDQGADDETGLVMVIGGYGSHLSSEYDVVLRRYIASKYNCFAASVEYFGQSVKFYDSLIPMPDFFVNLQKHYGVTVTANKSSDVDFVTRNVLKRLAEQGVTELHHDCRILRKTNSYQSFGFLPAIDHLQVFHDITQRHHVNKSRVFILGTSYGGYIALLLGRYAPQTFAMIIDNSGYITPNIDLYGDSYTFCVDQGVRFVTHETMVWSHNRSSPSYFGEHNWKIRCLLDPILMTPSATRHYLYHYVDDQVEKAELKIRFHDLLCRFAPAELTIVTDDGIDGTLFKSRTHGMKASLRHLFDRSYAAYLASAAPAHPPVTDFDMGSRYRFGCGSRCYQFSYSAEHGIRVDLL